MGAVHGMSLTLDSYILTLGAVHLVWQAMLL